MEDLSEKVNERSLRFIEENYGSEIIDFRDLIEKW